MRPPCEERFCLCEEQVKELALRTAQFDQVCEKNTNREDPWIVTGRQVQEFFPDEVLL